MTKSEKGSILSSGVLLGQERRKLLILAADGHLSSPHVLGQPRPRHALPKIGSGGPMRRS